jgi:hypothetical protein
MQLVSQAREATVCAARGVRKVSTEAVTSKSLARRRWQRCTVRAASSQSYVQKSVPLFESAAHLVPSTGNKTRLIGNNVRAQRKAIFIVLHSPVRAWMYRQKKAKYCRPLESARAAAYGTFFSILNSLMLMRAAIVQCSKMQICSFCSEIKGSLLCDAVSYRRTLTKDITYVLLDKGLRKVGWLPYFFQVPKKSLIWEKVVRVASI